MIRLEDALAIVAAAVRPAGAENVPLERAEGRVLATDLTSDVDWPPFDTTAMDGYAVRLADATPGMAVAERAGLIAAGAPPPPPLRPGEAARIMTGAPLPEGTEAIVPVERARQDGGRVIFEAAPAAGAHVRRRGESIAAGAKLLERGRRLRPSDVALAALAGADPVSVFRAPRVAIATTGDEVVRGSERPAPGRLRDSNGPMLVAECAARGWPARRLPAVADEPGAVAAMFARAGEDEDFLLTTGGVSAGDLDLLPAAAEASGFELLFHGVAMRPGKPIAFARRGGAFWLGLPGNPVSASVGFRIFGCEALARFEGDAQPAAPRFRARLAGTLPPAGDRDRFFDAVCAAAPDGIRATPLRSSGSHDLAAFARANALIHAAAGAPALAAGAEVLQRRIRAADQTPIAFTWWRRPSRELMILAPGFWRVRLARENLFLANHYLRSGYDVAALDFRGHGDSGGAYSFGALEALDLKAVVDALVGEGREYRSFTVLGLSLGGSIAAVTLGRFPDLPCRALAMISSPADVKALRPKPWIAGARKQVSWKNAVRMPRLSASSAATAWSRPPEVTEAISRLTMPKLIVTAEGDWLVDPSHGRVLAESSAPPVDYVHLDVPGNLHGDSLVRYVPLRLLRLLDRWFAKNAPPG